MSSELLRPMVAGVYQRLATGQLRADDVVTLDDLTVHSDPRWMRGFYDENRIIEDDAVVLAGFRRTNGTILDVGAHWGYMALSMRRSGTDCPIISFEAIEAHRDCLQEFKTLDRGNYDYVMTGVSDSTKELVFYGPVVNGVAVTGEGAVDRHFLPGGMPGHIRIRSRRPAEAHIRVPPMTGLPQNVVAGAVLADANLPRNVNYVFGLDEAAPQQWLAPGAYHIVWMLTLWALLFLPAHWLLARLWAPRQ